MARVLMVNDRFRGFWSMGKFDGCFWMVLAIGVWGALIRNVRT